MLSQTQQRKAARTERWLREFANDMGLGVALALCAAVCALGEVRVTRENAASISLENVPMSHQADFASVLDVIGGTRLSAGAYSVFTAEDIEHVPQTSRWVLPDDRALDGFGPLSGSGTFERRRPGRPKKTARIGRIPSPSRSPVNTENDSPVKGACT